MCKIVLLGFVRRLNYKITKRNVWKAGFCFRIQVHGGRRGVNKPLCWTLVELPSDREHTGLYHKSKKSKVVSLRHAYTKGERSIAPTHS
jgi:hypothetical protein